MYVYIDIYFLLEIEVLKGNGNKGGQEVLQMKIEFRIS